MADPETTSRPRVAAIVLNSVSHDTRVIKQAVSLQQAGYEVTVYGIRDNRCADPETRLPEGVRIVRCAWRSATYQLLTKVISWGGVIWLILLGTAYWHWSESIAAWLISDALMIKILGLLLLVGAGLALVRRPVRHFNLIARRYEQMEGNQPAVVQRDHFEHDRHPVFSVLSVMKSHFIGLLSRSIGLWVKKREMMRAMAVFKPDVVHCHDLSALPIGCAYSDRYGAAVVYDSHEIYEAVSVMSPQRRRWLERQQRRLSSKVKLFITINQSIAEYLNRKYPKLPPAVVVKNATRIVEETAPYDGRLHDAAGLDHSTRILLYQGGFSRFRGLSILVESAPLLPEGWVLVMMGWGTLEAELKALAQHVDPSASHIRFVPGAPLAELAQWTAGGSLGVIPYENVCLNHWYCTPNKLWEYPIAGVPILASDFPELQRTIEPNGIGRLLPDPLNPRDIAAAVASISDAELHSMRERCRAFIEADNWTVYARALIAAYQSLPGLKRSQVVSQIRDVEGSAPKGTSPSAAVSS